MKSTKKSLLLSTLSLVLCFAMLLGTTYAWFTDEVKSGVNQIKAGNLDVELYAGETKVTESTKLFTNIEKWEPGMIAYENFTVKNVGNLALKYQLGLTIGDKNATTAGHSLDEVLKATIVPGGFSGDRTAAQALTGYTDLKSFSVTGDGALEPGASGDTFAVVIYWQPTDSDNLYNLKNGLTATAVENKFTENELGIELGIKLTATQLPYEEDSFDKFYDKADNEVVATWSGESTEAAIPTEDGTSVKLEVKVGGDVKADATIDAGTMVKTASDETAKSLTENEALKLTIEPDGTPNGITVETAQSVTTYDVSLIKVVTSTEAGSEGTKTDVKVMEADKPVLVSLDIGIVDLVDFYHHGEKLTKVASKEAITAEGMYWYDQENGTVYFKTKSFSPFASVYKFAGGLGTEQHPYLIASADHFRNMTVSGTGLSNLKYYKLIKDIDLSGTELVTNNTYGFEAVANKAYIISIDGDNHSITYHGEAESIFGDFIATTLKNITINSDCPISGYLQQGIYDNVTVNGDMEFSNNTGVFGYYCNHSAEVKNCVINANIQSSSYSAVFFGYHWDGTYTVINSEFNGTYTGPYAGLVLGNGHYAAGKFILNNVKNNGVIRHALINRSSANPFCAMNDDGQATYVTIIYDDVELTNIRDSGTANNYVLKGSGQYVVGPEDSGLQLTVNDDKSLTITKSAQANVDHYEVEIMTNVANIGPNGGSMNISVLETIQATDATTFTPKLKNFGFADGTEATYTLADTWGIITIDGVDYYLDTDPNSNAAITPASETWINIRAYDASNKLVSANVYNY